MSSGSLSTNTRCEINVTPLIDVLLVLLIIFMIITPLTPSGLPALVPQDSPSQPSSAETPLVLQIMGNHQLVLNGHSLDADALKSVIGQLFSARANKVLFIQADQDLEYREVAQWIDVIRGINPSIEIGLSKALS